MHAMRWVDKPNLHGLEEQPGSNSESVPKCENAQGHVLVRQHSQEDSDVMLRMLCAKRDHIKSVPHEG